MLLYYTITKLRRYQINYMYFYKTSNIFSYFYCTTYHWIQNSLIISCRNMSSSYFWIFEFFFNKLLYKYFDCVSWTIQCLGCTLGLSSSGLSSSSPLRCEIINPWLIIPPANYYYRLIYWLNDWFLVLNGTFNNISAISWWPVLEMDEAGVSRGNHEPTLYWS